MKQVVLDTDTLSYILYTPSPAVAATARQYLRVFRYFTITAVTIAEVVKGFTLRNDAPAAADFLQRTETMEILPIEAEEAAVAGRILGELEQAGQKIGDLDPFIAAVAIVAGRPLVTNNLRHYRRIVNLGFPLMLENWREA